MKIREFFNKKINWGIAGFIVGILGVMIAVYSLIVYEPKPEIIYGIIGESNVIDVHKPLEELRIEYDGNEIQESKLNLRLITLIIKNTGDVTFRQSDHDQNLIWGFKISDGELIDNVRLVNSSSKYIESYINPSIIGKDIVSFDKIIFEEDARFTLELLIIHPQDLSPKIVPIGKLAGLDSIEIIEDYGAEDEKKGAIRVFNNSILDGILTILIGFIIMIAGVGVVILLAKIYEKTVLQLIRKYSFKKFEEILIETSSENHKTILRKFYNVGGLKCIDIVHQLLNVDEFVNWIIEFTKLRETYNRKLSLTLIELSKKYKWKLKDDTLLGRHKIYEDDLVLDCFGILYDEGMLAQGNKTELENFKSSLKSFLTNYNFFYKI